MFKIVAFDMDGTIADTIPMCIKHFAIMYPLMQTMNLAKKKSYIRLGLMKLVWSKRLRNP